MNDLVDEAIHLWVARGHDAKPVYQRLDKPAAVTYNGVLYVVEHIPLLEIVPGVCPESYFNGEMDGGLEAYRLYCNDFYQEVDEEHIIPSRSLNIGELIPFSTARITDQWIDAKLDDGWRYIRVPLSSVVVLKPYEGISHDTKALEIYDIRIGRF